MKTFQLLTLAFAFVAMLPSCSLKGWGSGIKVIEVRREVTLDGRIFITRRYQVNSSPLETFTETRELGQSWAATY
jgi:hypothetical protein